MLGLGFGLSGVPAPLLSPFFSAFSAFGALSECAVCNRLAVDTVRERLTRGGGVRTSIRRGPLRRLRPVGAIDELRSARPMDTPSTSQGSLRWLGRPWMGGSGSTCGGFVRFSCTQSEDRIPFDVLVHLLWPPDPWAAQDWG